MALLSAKGHVDEPIANFPTNHFGELLPIQ
jgi:hypothetical protein